MNNYLPFNALEVGALFRDLDHPELLLMKLSSAEQAVVLEGAWVDNTLYARGTCVPYGRNECVSKVDEPAAVELPVQRKDPIDPRRKFWKPGDTHRVGRDHHALVPVFAGLFVYSGFGAGTYYSAVDNEQFWCGSDKAQEMARREGIPHVHIDGAHWTLDPLLTREREEAQQRFDQARDVSVA